MALQEEFEQQGNILFKYRGYLPIAILFIALVIYGHDKATSQNYDFTIYDQLYEYSCFLVSLTGLVIRSYIVGFSPRNTSGRNTKDQLADELNTTGVYSICRHPLYVGNFIMWLGLAMMTESLNFIVIFCLSFWIYYERIMFAEEQYLRKKFGDIYLLWAGKTPAFFPDFSKWKSTKRKFSWKKVTKQEKTGLLALMVVFFLFQSINVYYTPTLFYTDKLFWIICLALAVFIYVIIKFLETKTKLLELD